MTSFTKRFLSLLLPLAVLATAGEAAAVTAGGVTVDVVAVQSWPGGFNGAVRITNNSFPSAITSFQVVFKMGGTAGIQGNGWNGTISSPDGSGNRTARNAAWMGSLATGRTWDEGFSGNGTFEGATIVSLTVNGQSISLGGTGGDVTPPTVSLSSSATNVTTAQTITLTATASDASGIAKVEFYDGSTLLGTDTTSPYSWQVALTAANNGTHSYTAKATDASSNANAATSAAVSVVVNIQQQTTDFAISAPASASVTQGQSTTATVTITRTNFTSSVSCSASGLPSGVTASWNPTSTTGTSTVATLAASSSATTGTSNVTVTCTGGSITKTATIALTVSPVSTSTFAIAAPATATVNRGASVTATVTITRTNFTSSVSCSASGLPSGVTASWSPTSTTGTSTVATLAATSTATLGAATVTITCTGGSITKTASVALTVGSGQSTTGKFRVVNGRITKDGAAFPVHCGSWFGLQGRYEPAYDSANPRGAPMEQYVGNTFWASTHTRTVMQTMNEIKAAGITVIRLPVVHQTLNPTDAQGNGSLFKNYSGIINDATYPMKNARQAMESMIKAANSVGIAVMLDIHSCSNYIDWRKGRLDARPPWVDATRNDYDYKREEWSCADTLNPSTVTKTQPYNETIWLQDLKTLAGLSQSLGVSNIIGIDIFNEPWDYTWSEWKTLTEHAYQAINGVNPNLLLFVQGISGSAGNQDGTPDTKTQTPHGDTATNPNWGENLYPAGSDLPNVPVEQLVWSPHTYGPSVAVQPMFMDPSQPQCAGLEGDAAGDAKCQMVINSTLLRSGWEEHFGYLKDLGYAIVVGEFGGNMDWPLGQASLRDQARFSYLTDKSIDAKWQNAFVDYMIQRKIEGCYWSINPESGDTGGWYGHAYDPVSNTGGWGEWKAFDSRKTTLLNRHWAGVP